MSFDICKLCEEELDDFHPEDCSGFDDEDVEMEDEINNDLK